MPILKTNHGDIHYSRQGRGGLLVIALHGYGDDHTVFKAFQTDDKFTVIAIDLPFHGNTRWNKGYYQVHELVSVIQQLLSLEEQQLFIALGHSLGGRLWLSLLPHFPTQIQQLILLAPDGLNTEGMALIDWMPFAMRWGFSKLLGYPGSLLKIAQLLRQLSILSPFSYRYLKYQLMDQDRLRSMKRTWLSLAYFPMNKTIAHKNIQSTNIPTHVYLGTKDDIVPAEKLRSIFRKLSQVKIIECDTDHRGVIIEFMKEY
jgi:pimeloyl-ACP methyl ester carboxylesterase